jgi:Na+/proline symporter
MEILAFIVFLALFIFVGTMSSRKHSADDIDYLMAGRDVSPLLTALSAAALFAFGWLFNGLVGACVHL